MSLIHETATALEDYLRSAVVFDDQLNLEADEAVPGHLPDPRSLVADDETAVRAPSSPVRVPALVTSFADIGVVCAVHDPRLEGEEKLADRFVELAAQADVSIVDWTIDSSDGLLAIDLLEKLAVREDELQIVVIYTAQDVREITRSIEDHLRDFERVQNAPDFEELPMWQCASTLTFVLPKTVAEEEVPEEIIKRLSGRLVGILRTITLRNAARIRAAVPRVLDLLGPDLDAGIISHAIVTESEDARMLATGIAFDEITADALADGHHDLFSPASLAACAEELFSRPRTDDAADSDWLPSLFSADDLSPRLGPSGNDAEHPDELWKVLGRQGEDSSGKKLLDGRPLGALTSRFVPRGRDADRQLLALSVTSSGWPRRRKRGVPMELGAGVILRVSRGDVRDCHEPADGMLLVCMTAECDAVRLEGATAFTFAQVVEWGDNTHRNRTAFGYAVELGPSDEERHLMVNLRFKDLRSITFAADPERRVVVLQSDGEIVGEFLDPTCGQTHGARFSVEGRLKSDVANRIRAELSQQAARIGTNQYRPDRKHRS